MDSVDLTEKGIAEANKAGELLKENGFNFDKAYTSYLKRADRHLIVLWINWIRIGFRLRKLGV